MNHIVCFHLYNDYSGSPRILYLVIKGLLKKGYQIDLISSTGGILDQLQLHDNFRHRKYKYHFSNNHFISILKYCCIQLYTSMLGLTYLFKHDTIFYINTILPIGPALIGRLIGKRVVYHYHEDATTKGGIYRFLCSLMQCLATDIICVSKYQRSSIMRKENVSIIPNALSNDFIMKLSPNPERAFKAQTILMISSLKLYKGVLEFIQLAKSLHQFQFLLVINDNKNNIDVFCDKYTTSEIDNLQIYCKQSDVTPFYNKSSIVLNLSDKKRFIETFGLTALEAMSCGLPIIVPTVGGISEMVIDGENGWRIDTLNMDLIENKISTLLSEKSTYYNMASHAFEISKLYSENNFIQQIENVLSH